MTTCPRNSWKSDPLRCSETFVFVFPSVCVQRRRGSQAHRPFLADMAVGLLSLPHELLVLVGRQVAPEGGRAIASLRCTCAPLARVLFSVLAKRIHVPRDRQEADTLLASIAWNVGGIKAFIHSVRWDVSPEPLALAAHLIASLPALRSLSLHGEFPPNADSDGTLEQAPLPSTVASILDKVPTLDRLEIHNLEITERRGLHHWAPTVTSLSLNDCLGSSRPYFGQTRLASASLLLPSKVNLLLASWISIHR